MYSLLSVYRIEPNQGQVYRELKASSLREAPDAFDDSLTMTLALDLNAVDQVVANRSLSDQEASFILYTEGYPAGLISAAINQRAFLSELWVAPAVRHLRGGELLVNTAIDWLKEKGADEVYAWIPISSKDAMSFYERVGFSVTGESEVMANNPLENRLLFVRSLCIVA